MLKKKKSISVVIPAYNEEKSLKDAVNSVVGAVKKFEDYEIFIFDDCSKDKTGEIADKLAAKNKKIKAVHNKTNKGLGYNYMAASRLASMEYFTMFPGDNENSIESFSETLDKIGEADIIIAYTENNEVRSWQRRFISKSFIFLINFLFNLKIKYYNGLNVYRTKDLKAIEITTFGFAYSSEVLIKLLKKGGSYKEIGIKIKPTSKTSIFKTKNIISVFKTIVSLFFDVNMKNRKIYNRTPVRIS